MIESQDFLDHGYFKASFLTFSISQLIMRNLVHWNHIALQLKLQNN
jgi:hypothetical protein